MAQSNAVILCVDDEENPLLLRKLVLQKHGYEVVTARSGKEALEFLPTLPVNLVLSDIMMPGMAGTELARRIKDLRPELPVVLISGVNEIPEDAAHADLFVSKVEGPAKMCAKISQVLEDYKNRHASADHALPQ